MTLIVALLLAPWLGWPTRQTLRAARRLNRQCDDWWSDQSARVLCATGPVRLHD